MSDTTFASGTVITNCNHLWHVDTYESGILVAISTYDDQAEQQKLPIPFKDIRSDRLELPSLDIVGYLSAYALSIHISHLNLLHSIASHVSLRRNCVTQKGYRFVSVGMASETSQVWTFITEDVGLGQTMEAKMQPLEKAGLCEVTLVTERRRSNVAGTAS